MAHTEGTQDRDDPSVTGKSTTDSFSSLKWSFYHAEDDQDVALSFYELLSQGEQDDQNYLLRRHRLSSVFRALSSFVSSLKSQFKCRFTHTGC